MVEVCNLNKDGGSFMELRIILGDSEGKKVTDSQP